MKTKAKRIPMYRLSSTNDWYNGMQFDSLASAVEKCKSVDPATCVVDVIAYTDHKTFRAVYSNRQINTGTYRKGC